MDFSQKTDKEIDELFRKAYDDLWQSFIEMKDALDRKDEEKKKRLQDERKGFHEYYEALGSEWERRGLKEKTEWWKKDPFSSFYR